MLTFLLDFGVLLRIITQVPGDSDQSTGPRATDTLAQRRPSANLNHMIHLSSARELGNFLVPFGRLFVIDGLNGIRRGTGSDEGFEDLCHLGELVVG